ncbi:MAG: hypothetical protein HON53_08905 [Planctomycetaceae bacterium]|jgi:hypothetical protein|nr:hypothetical protein [Planctomycetaceae bacterium]MBT6155918.1 hypothetical protein [Planctomycetaceae bacterium]MBT6483167.1 hypothetical protein [Planctomycetaceae bacterium]
MQRFLPALITGIVLLSASFTEAQTSYPMVMSLHPTAAQVGQTSEHVVQARYSMFGAYQVLVSGEGVTGEVTTPMTPGKDGKKPSLTKITLKFTVAPNARPGVRDFRIATPQGASTLGQLVIVRDPVVVEKEKNNTAELAQAVTVPSTVCGVIGRAEDVDVFKFQAAAGQSLNFHVRSMRLQNRIHDLQKHSDPIMALRNAAGSTLVTSDNHFAGDPFFSYKFEQAGEYLLEIRDVRYQGNTYWEYSVEIGDRPFVSNVFPMGIARGADVQLQLIGTQLPQNPMAGLKLPLDAAAGPQWLELPMGETLTNPVPVVVSELPPVVESQMDNNAPEKGQLVTVPVGISGRIEGEADIDCFTFEAKKGEKFSVEVLARRWQSSLDSHIRILDEKGKQLSLNDDLKLYKRSFQDSWIENWTAPADGKFVIEIRDMHLRGGDSFVYYLRVTRSQPYFELYLDSDKTQLTPGTSGVLFANVVRKNGFTGEIQLHIDGLPAGVTATCGRILDGQRDGCIVLEAPAGAPLSMTNVVVTGTAMRQIGEGEPSELKVVAVPYQETYQPGGGRGHWPVGTHTVSVGAPSDVLNVKLSTYDVTLKPGESVKIDVEIVRAEGFSKNVTLDALYRHLSSTYANTLPPGVTIDSKSSKTLLTGKVSKGHITLVASAKAAPVAKQQASIMANISLNFVMKATYSARPLLVTVTAP